MPALAVTVYLAFIVIVLLALKLPQPVAVYLIVAVPAATAFANPVVELIVTLPVGLLVKTVQL